MPTSRLAESLAVPRFANALRSCPLCESDGVAYEFVVDGRAFSRCNACALLFVNPPPREAEAQPSRAFVEGYGALRAFAERALGREVCSVLVVHCGNPPSDSPATRCRPEELGGVVGSFDLVVACDVLDRQADPVALSAALRSRIAPGGLLLVTVASPASRDARAQRDRWPGFRANAHWWLTVDTLQLLLTRAGYADFLPVAAAADLGNVTPETVRFFGSHIALLCRPVERSEARVLSIIVPVYNEASTVAELLDTVLAKTIDGVDIEVVIVESNSTDGSRAIVERYASHPRVRIVLEDRPRGKGFAVRTGLAHARGEVVLFQDADLEYDVNDYDRLVEPLFALRRTFVLGSRHGASGDGWKIRQFTERKLTSTVMNFAHLALLTMFNRLYRQSLFDPFTMYKVFRRDCLYGLTFECNRFDFDYEIAIKLIRKGHQPVELPVNYRSRSFGEGKKVSFLGDPPTWVRAMLRLRTSPLYAFTTDAGERNKPAYATR